jgi:hypothetical protein
MACLCSQPAAMRPEVSLAGQRCITSCRDMISPLAGSREARAPSSPAACRAGRTEGIAVAAGIRARRMLAGLGAAGGGTAAASGRDRLAGDNGIRDGIRRAGRHAVGSEAWWQAVTDTRTANSDHMAEEEREALPDFRRHASPRGPPRSRPRVRRVRGRPRGRGVAERQRSRPLHPGPPSWSVTRERTAGDWPGEAKDGRPSGPASWLPRRPSRRRRGGYRQQPTCPLARPGRSWAEFRDGSAESHAPRSASRPHWQAGWT